MAKRQQTTPSVTAEDPVQLGTGLLISWTGTATRRLVVAWPSGTVTYPVSGPGQRTILAKELGTIPISTRANGLTIAQTTAVVQEAPVDVVVVIPEPPPPPPTAPQVIAVTPLVGAVGRAVTVNAVATFDMDMDPATITGATMTISPSVANAVSYDAATKKATLNPTADLANGTEYTVTLSTTITNTSGTPLAVPYSWSFTTEGAPVGTFALMGYARVAGVTGGEGGTVIDCTTWSDVSAALQASGTRHIKLHGSGNLDGGGDTFDVNNDNVTLDGSDFTGQLKNYKIVFQCNNVIIYEMAMRPGEGSSAGASADRRALSFNPGSGNTISGIAVINTSLAWGPDVVFSAINDTRDITCQRVLFGPSLYKSNIASSPNGYGPNFTVPGNNAANEAAEHVRRATLYRCLMAFNHQRNLKAEYAEWWEAINCAIYGWGNQAGHGNPRGASIAGTMYKKSPDTAGSNEVWEPDTNYSEFNNSTYFPLSGPDANIGIGFTPTVNIAGAARITSPYGGSLTETVAPADATLYASVVNAAGRTFQDAVDIDTKTRALAGTSLGGDGFYNGAGFPAPHPFF